MNPIVKAEEGVEIKIDIKSHDLIKKSLWLIKSYNISKKVYID